MYLFHSRDELRRPQLFEVLPDRSLRAHGRAREAGITLDRGYAGCGLARRCAMLCIRARAAQTGREFGSQEENLSRVVKPQQ